MNKKKKYFIWIALVLILCGSCRSGNGDLPPLEETFSQKDKNPFGAYVMYQQLDLLYFHNNIAKVTSSFEDTWANISDTNGLYINISNNLYLSAKGLDAMLAFVENGNSLFISCNNIDPLLLDTLGCKISTGYYQQSFAEMENTVVKTIVPNFGDTAAYQYFYVPFYNHFTSIDSANSKALGKNKWGINYIVVFYGKGRFYLHTDPRALSNYFLLEKDNYKYLRNIFSFTPAVPEQVYWDNYYNKRNHPDNGAGSKSGLAVLLKYPAMAWAFWLLMALFALYILFGGKRRQRIVETIEPNTNTTLSFTETISRLYLQQKDNRNIADKLVTYFHEHIRNQFYLNTSVVNDDFINTLSRKSNNSKQGTGELFKSINTIHQAMEVSDEKLLSLNQQIEKFYKNQL